MKTEDGDLFNLYDEMLFHESIMVPRFFVDKAKKTVLSIDGNWGKCSWPKILLQVH